jgi:sugar fermentation stimulation protein A
MPNGEYSMIYPNIVEGRFLSRPNRFIANVMVNGRAERAHVKNTGRCRELLLENAVVYLQKHDDPNRSTGWSLIGVEKGNQIVNIDSQAPNKVIHEWLLAGGLGGIGDILAIRPEFTYGDSRIDFLVETTEEKILMEVKGVTLEEDGVAMFPDAPTERGIKHLLELCKSLKDGYRPVVAFVLQMTGIRYFTPNVRTHKAFADALCFAQKEGVRVLALDCDVGRDSLAIKSRVDVRLNAGGS